MENFKFSPRWVHKMDGDKVKSLICSKEEDFKVLIEGGYTDSPKSAKEGLKHSLHDFYFDEIGKIKPVVKEVDTDISIEDVYKLSWPELKKYGKKLEGVFNVEIITKTSKKEEVLKKIKELRNADSTTEHK